MGFTRHQDYAEAKHSKHATLEKWQLTFDDLRRRATLSADDVHGAVWDHYSAALTAGDKERASRPSPDELDTAFHKAVLDAQASGASDADAGQFAMLNAMADYKVLAGKADWGKTRRTTRLNRLRAELSNSDTRLIRPAVDECLADKGFTIPKTSQPYRDLCYKFMRADIEQLVRYAERDRGDSPATP